MTDGFDGDLGDKSLLDLFRMEADNQCNKLSEDLIALDQEPGAAGLLESLMRAAHSVKGAARVVGLHSLVQIAHAMEDVFVAAQTNKITLDQDAIDLLLNGVDLISAISQEVSVADTDSFLMEKTAEIDSLVGFYSLLVKGKESGCKASVETSTDPATCSGQPAQPAPAKKNSGTPVDIRSMSMLDLFRMEADNHCTKINDSLIALENDLTSAVLLESLMRASHSIRGAARIVELHSVAKLAHAMEDAFTEAHQRKVSMTSADIPTLLNGADLLAKIAKIPQNEMEQWQAENNAEIDSLVLYLKKISERKKTVSTSQSAAVLLPPTVSPKSPALGKDSIPQQKTESIAQPLLEKKNRMLDEQEDFRSVQVSAKNMDRLMGLAGESLIESRWLPTFNRELLRLKYNQDELYGSMDKIWERINDDSPDEMTVSLFADMQHKLELCRTMLKQDMEVLEDHARHSASISHRLYKEIITNKMRPFIEGIRGFKRMVHNVARELGKEVNLEIIGPDTLVDLDILNRIEAPLNHMIRNALDHGIEPASERLAQGKAGKGTIQLIARHIAGMLSITVKDDGRGVNLEKIRQTIVEKKLCSPAMAADLSEHELLDFLFLPNFTTQKSVSKLSGRGVGLDVVHSVVNDVRGKISSSTKQNVGTSFELQLPLTLSVLKALLTEINGEPYALPLVSIDHVLQLTPDQIQEVEGRQYFTFNEKRIGIVSAQQIFKSGTPSGADDRSIHVIVFSDRMNLYGLTVDKILGVCDLVVQRLDPRLGKIKGVNSASILEDGTPVLIIDVEDLFRSLDKLISGNLIMPIACEDALMKKSKRILVVDDSITVREVEKKMLLARGYMVDVAVDGVDAWNTVREKEYDLIISDIDMPRMNGFELVSLIKNEPNLSNLPVIIVSSKDRNEERNKGFEIGADFYLPKGNFHDQALVEAVLELIGEA